MRAVRKCFGLLFCTKTKSALALGRIVLRYFIYVIFCFDGFRQVAATENKFSVFCANLLCNSKTSGIIYIHGEGVCLYETKIQCNGNDLFGVFRSC